MVNNKTVYFTEHLQKKLNSISGYTVTLVETPAGYGKTTAIKEYLNNADKKTYYINILNSSQDLFWGDFCDIISEIDEEIEKGLRITEWPKSEKNIASIKSLLRKIKISEETYIIVDNYHFVGNTYMDMFISSIIDILPDDLHFMFMTQSVTSPILTDIIESERVLYINKEDFLLTDKDIIGFFAENGIELGEEDAKWLYEYSEGWISVIYLQMLNYKDTGKLDEDISIEQLLDRALWKNLTDSEKYFLICLSRIDRFNLKEAELIKPEEMTKEDVEAFLKRLVFLRFDKTSRHYYIHHIFNQYLDTAYKSLEKKEQNIVTVLVGKIYEYRGIIIDAYKRYYEAGEWDLIYGSTPTLDNIYPYINSENKSFFLSIVNECPSEIRDKYYYFPIIMCFVLFLYNEKEKLIEHLMNIVYAIEDNTEIEEKQRNQLLGTVYYVRGYTEYNNISMMTQFFKKALDFVGSSIIGLTSNFPYTYSCPSVLNLFYNENESVDNTVEELSECMPYYYKLSDGHGKGAEALIKAEALYNKGDFDSAEILTHKALYMADSREQTCIKLGSLLLLTRMSVFTGDYDFYHENLESIHKKVKYTNSATDIEYINMVDMCEGFMHAAMDDKDKIAEWLTDSESIETRLKLVTMSYANLIYGKYLYLNEDYHKLLGISGQFLGIASVFNTVLPEIYTYIYIAMANNALDNAEKAEKMLKIALDLAINDLIIMPFVENERYISEMFEKIGMESNYRDFIKKIRTVAKKYNIGVKSIQKNARNKDNYGLTARELDVAKLAAERLSNKEIAEKLFIAEGTVKSNLKIIFNKLDINSRTELSKFFK